MISDAAGNFYGANTMGGGSKACSFGCGAIFELALGQNGARTYNVLYDFQGGADGAQPNVLTLGPDGNLYGTTYAGGVGAGGPGVDCPGGCGTVFKLTRPSAGGLWTKEILYTFAGGADGGEPATALIFDKAGNIYGTTSVGGNQDSGTFFELSPSASGDYSKQILFQFAASISANPAFLTLGADGNFYGTTVALYIYPWPYPGVVFKLAPEAGGEWHETILHDFFNTSPISLAFDAFGDIVVTTDGGEHCIYCGSLFELKPSGKKYTLAEIYSFSSEKHGAAPNPVALDAAGNIYGTTYLGGSGQYGVAYKLTEVGGKWNESILYNFAINANGGDPFSGVLLDSAGNLYGATFYGGTAKEPIGTLFEIQP
jgi:hypothetical protein